MRQVRVAPQRNTCRLSSHSRERTGAVFHLRHDTQASIPLTKRSASSGQISSPWLRPSRRKNSIPCRKRGYRTSCMECINRRKNCFTSHWSSSSRSTSWQIKGRRGRKRGMSSKWRKMRIWLLRSSLSSLMKTLKARKMKASSSKMTAKKTCSQCPSKQFSLMTPLRKT